MTQTVVRYEPRGGAKQLLSAREQEVCIAGPAGTGKSLAMLQKAHYTSLKAPGCRSLIVRQTHASLTGSTLVTFEQQVVADALAQGVVRWFGGSARKPAAYVYDNGSEIVVGGLDRPEKFLSTEFSRIYVDEATQITLTALETLISRLRGNADAYRQIVLACNPDHPQHWLKLRCDTSRMRMLYSRHRDNPMLYNADGTLTERGVDYMAKLDALTGVRRLRLRDGIWAASEGVIYEDFDPAIHVIDSFPIPDNWQRWWVCDFGYTNPLCLQMWCEDPDGRLYLYREIYRTKRTVAEHGLDIMRTVADEDPARPGRWIWREKKPRAIICDHDAEGRVVLSQAVGIGTIPARKGVADGIQAVQKRLQPAGDGKPRLFLMRGALVSRDQELVDAKRPTCTEEEIAGYVWDPPPVSGKVTAPKEVPLKENDHGMDALRYLCAEREIGAPRMRMM